MSQTLAERVAYNREWRKRNPDRLKEHNRKRNGNPKYLAFRKDWNEKNKDKRRVQRYIANRIHRGKWQRPEVCSACKSVGKILAHHPDYAQPLKVEWLCERCHREKHNK